MSDKVDKRCGTCKWWQRVGNANRSSGSIQPGWCRRNTPILDPDSGWGAWPETTIADWCGEYQPKEPTDE
jgi:hypothetical protein